MGQQESPELSDSERALVDQLMREVAGKPFGDQCAILERHRSESPRVFREVVSLLVHMDHTIQDRFLAEPPQVPVDSMESTASESNSPSPVGLGQLGYQPHSDSDDIAEQPGDWIGTYKLVRTLGEGGFGIVWLAKRSEPHVQYVALKIIKPGMDSKAVIARFEQERQVLAALNHANIARLYDGGKTDDGRPYFAMEYVEGLAINEYCDSHRLRIAERLELFRHVCSAVHYAHQNLVVHRDLKPGNILVTKEGVPKLVDFGIAKIINPSLAIMAGDPTAPEMRIMTPEYASPEQVKGQPITTATDIYSLGVVLYELLTGHRPYRLKSRIRAEIERVICTEDPEKPSTAISRVEVVEDPTTGKPASTRTVTPEEIAKTREGQIGRLRKKLAGDIDNIVLMAMRKEPQRRYKSAEQFSDDLQRHLTGMPVIARPDTFGYRARKFVKRNRGPVVAAAVIAISLLGGIFGTTRMAREARHQQLVAQAERDKFKNLYDSALETLDKSSGEFDDEIRNLAGAMTSREIVSKMAERYYDLLLRVGGNDPQLRDYRARILERKSDLLGSKRNPNLAFPEKAMSSADEALVLREALAADAPADETAQRLLARTLIRKGDALYELDRFDEALSIYERAASILESAANGTNPHDETFETYQWAVTSWADVLDRRGLHEEALVVYRRAHESRERVLREKPNDGPSLRAVSVTAVRIGHMARALERPDEALRHYEQALTLRRSRLRLDPDSNQAKRDVAIAHYWLAELHNQLEQFDEAVRHCQDGLAAAEPLLSIANEEAKDEARAPRDVALLCAAMGVALRGSGRPEEALVQHRRALELVEPLADPARGDLTDQTTVAYQRFYIGRILAQTSDGEEARVYLMTAKNFLDPRRINGTARSGDLEVLAEIDGLLGATP